MKQPLTNRKGNAFVWFALLASLFGLAIMYLALTPAFNQITDTLSVSDFTAQQNTTWNKITTVWYLWPVVTLVAMLLYGIIATIRSDTVGGFK